MNGAGRLTARGENQLGKTAPSSGYMLENALVAESRARLDYVRVKPLLRGGYRINRSRVTASSSPHVQCLSGQRHQVFPARRFKLDDQIEEKSEELG
jgi:hypothetical protein